MIPFGSALSVPGEEFEVHPGQAGPPCEFTLWCKRPRLMLLDDPVLIEGAPCLIQVFTSSMRDEECIAISSIIDGILRK